jgi:predicted RNA-binding Zn ribbon-like protein
VCQYVQVTCSIIAVLRLTCQSGITGYVSQPNGTGPIDADGHAHPHGHVAALDDGLAFVNTLAWKGGQPVDRLPSAEAALDWFYEHDLLHADARDTIRASHAASQEAAARDLAKMHRLRAAMRELVEATVERRPPARGELAIINRALRTRAIFELVVSPDGVSLGHRHEGDPIEGGMSRLTEVLARAVSQGEPERLRICANPQCRIAFVDTSRTGQRKWCDMATCGNRAKAARHRARQRERRTPDAAPSAA